MGLLEDYPNRYEACTKSEMSLEEYLTACRHDPSMYANTAERLLVAIGEPKMVDTSQNPRLSRIFSNKVIPHYEVFEEFYGLEEPIEQIISYLRHAAQGLEEKNQILYLLGPVGGGKSSIAEKLKSLVEKSPIYAIKGSPIQESPLNLFNKTHDGPMLEEEYGIPRRYLSEVMSPWAVKRLQEFQGDLRRFRVVKLMPSRMHQIAIAKTEPGDENNQDISTLVGKVDIRKLDRYAQDDPDCYSFSGGLCHANQGLLEFIEMFKAPIKVLHPLLTATQEGNYNPTEGLSPLPFNGIILAHSNESEWLAFKNNRKNEAFIDRIYVVKVPYVLRISEEVKIYEKLLRNSSLANAPCAPRTLRLLAEFMILSRLKEPENSNVYSKMHIYNGENFRDTDPKAKSLQEYHDYAGHYEGMTGLSTRFAFKTLSRVLNFDQTEIGINPVHLFHVLENQIQREQFPQEIKDKYLRYLKEYIIPEYIDFLGKEIQTTYLESYGELGQNMFDRYVQFADYWLQEQDYRDQHTGEIFDHKTLNDELEKIEKPAGITNTKDFRNEIVNFVLRARASNYGKNPDWKSYEKMRSVIEKRMFSHTEDLLPVISFNPHVSSTEQRKHEDFIERMKQKGYSAKQIRLLCEWYLRIRKSS